MAAFNFLACSSGEGGSTATTGSFPTLATCQKAPLCEPLALPSFCSFDGTRSFACVAPAPDGGGASDAGAPDGGVEGSLLSATQAARLQCSLEALRDRKAGGLATLVAYKGSDTCGTRVEIVSFGEGSASVLPVIYCELEAERGEAVRRELQPVAFFEECLASTDEMKRLQCLADAVTTKGASGGVCSCRGIAADEIRGICRSE